MMRLPPPTNGNDTVTALLTAVLGVSSAILLLNKSNQRKKRVHPQPQPIPPPPLCTAGLVTIIRQISSTNMPWFFYHEMLKLKSKVYQIYFPGPGHFWIVSDYQLQRKILTHPSCDKPQYNIAETVSGGCSNIGSRSTFNEKWKMVRKSAAHAFSANEVKRMNTICSTHVNKWLEQVIDLPLQQNNNDGVCIDPSVEMTRITFGSIVQAAFEYEPTDEEFHKMHAAIDSAMIEYAIRRPINPFRALFSWFIQDSRDAVAAIDVIGSFCQKLLDTHRVNKKNNTISTTNKTLIQIIESNDALSDKEKVSEIIAFLVAGHDTTSYTLSTLLCLLAQYPEEQAKVRASFNTTATDENSQPEVTDVLQNAMLEARRLLPVAAMVSVRKLLQDVHDETWGTIPAEMLLYMPQLSTQRDADVYEDPDEFRPDRWITPTQAMKDCLLSFSLGKRNCIGQSLANAELNSILPKLLSTYTFTLVEKGRLENFLTMKYQGCVLRVTKNIDAE